MIHLDNALFLRILWLWVSGTKITTTDAIYQGWETQSEAWQHSSTTLGYEDRMSTQEFEDRMPTQQQTLRGFSLKNYSCSCRLLIVQCLGNGLICPCHSSSSYALVRFSTVQYIFQLLEICNSRLQSTLAIRVCWELRRWKTFEACAPSSSDATGVSYIPFTLRISLRCLLLWSSQAERPYITPLQPAAPVAVRSTAILRWNLEEQVRCL